MRETHESQRFKPSSMAQPVMMDYHSDAAVRDRGLRVFYFLLACLCVVMAVIMLVRGRQILNAFPVQTAPTVVASDTQKIQSYQSELNHLQSRVAGLIKDSVERRIRDLERNLQQGQLGADGLKAIDEIKAELMFLQGVAASSDTAAGSDDPQRFSPNSHQGMVSASAKVSEIAELRVWFYAGVASFGVSALLLCGACLRTQPQWRLLRSQHRAAYLPAASGEREMHE